MASKLLAAILVLGTASLPSALCRSQAQESSSAALASAVSQGTGGPTSANAKLEETVYFMLRRDNQLRTANLKVYADVTKNEVTLSGTVDSEAMRDKAAELAKTAQVGVVAIIGSK